MALTTVQQLKLARQFGRECYVKPGATANLSTADLIAAMVAQEAFITSNATAINNAFPEPFKSAATLAQKRLAMALVAAVMAGILDLGD